MSKIRVCYWCDRVFQGDEDKLYCSKECEQADKLSMGPGYIPGMITCDHCGTQFKAKKYTRYCSRRCSQQANGYWTGETSKEGSIWDARRLEYDGDAPSNVDHWL